MSLRIRTEEKALLLRAVALNHTDLTVFIVRHALLAANPAAVNQVYNAAVNARTGLKELYDKLFVRLLPLFPQLQGCKPVYRDFRRGDVLHSQADISKAEKYLGYAPTHMIDEGLDAALEWYIKNLR